MHIEKPVAIFRLFSDVKSHSHLLLNQSANAKRIAFILHLIIDLNDICMFVDYIVCFQNKVYLCIFLNCHTHFQDTVNSK